MLGLSKLGIISTDVFYVNLCLNTQNISLIL